MTDQELSEFLAKHKEAEELTLQGIDQLNKGHFKEALPMFEKSLEINPKSIPALLYHSLCCFSLIQDKAESNLEGITHPEIQQYIQDMISSLNCAADFMSFIRIRLQLHTR